jgi:hypothetical protein
MAMSRMAAGLRGTVVVFAVASAVAGAVPPVQRGWLAVALVVAVGWTGVYVYLAWTRSLMGWMIAVDIAVATGFCLALGVLVPVPAQSGGVSWVSDYASIVVVCAQLAGRPVLSVPAGLLVPVGFVTGSGWARVTGGGVQEAITMSIQAIAAAATMVVAVRTGRAAAAVFARLQREEHAAELRSIEAADELAQLALVHNGPLTTLTMAGHAAGERPSLALRQRAAADLAELPRLATGGDHLDRSARLDERLARIVVLHQPQLAVSATLPSCHVPEPVAEAFAQAVKESLENVVRHSGQDEAAVDLSEEGSNVSVVVIDHGRGFDPAGLPPLSAGLRTAVHGGMRRVGGSTSVRSAPGEGTEILLEWRRG